MIGTTLSHYRILEPLGTGGMGEVYRAHDEHLDRDVAVKVLSRLALDDPTLRERFRREALVLSRLSHPGVATVFDFDTQDGVDFLVDKFSAPYLMGANIDFVDGLNGAGFKIGNPNAKSTCGCGESFGA